MRTVITLLFLIFLFSLFWINYTKNLEPSPKITCIGGVSYYYTYRRLAPVYNSDTLKVERCSTSDEPTAALDS